MVRRFKTSQRIALYLYAKGRCANAACGKPLVAGWHADHQIPWSLGGETDVSNGNALCPACNLKKGDRIEEVVIRKQKRGGDGERKALLPWPQGMQLRAWQQRAFNCWLIRKGRDFLLVATPGAGKTRVALRIAHHMLMSGEVSRIVIVCPTEHIRKQWADAAHETGIALDPKWLNAYGVEVVEDYHGIAVTYQQISFAPDLFDKQCDASTLVIFDEVHHAADNLSWGDALRRAFHRATERLALSGTPFRNDNYQIPFITYHEGRSKAGFSYSYAEALADGVCRPIYFPTVNGRARWLSRDGSFIDCWLLDDVPRAHATERLRTVLDAGGGWLPSVLKAANDKLSEIRASGHSEAGALVIAIDQGHAKEISRLLLRITGTAPVLAISEDADASAKIQRFTEGADRFLVCVKMVSEGVDIPRLRVGVFATNVTTELFLRQAIGRFVRVICGLEEQSATLYLPAVEPIITFARQIKEERDHQLAQAKSLLPGMLITSSGKRYPDEKMGAFMPLDSTPIPHDTIFDGASFSQAELAYAERLRRELCIPVPTPQLAAALRRHASDKGVFVNYNAEAGLREQNQRPPTPLTESKPPVIGIEDDAASRPMSSERDLQVSAIISGSNRPVYARKEELRKQTQKAAAKLGGLLGVRPWVLHKQWIEMGGMPQEEATLQDLERKIAFFLERIAEINQKRNS